MEIQKIDAARLNPAAYNPRKDLKPGNKEYEKLKRSVEEFGFVEPIIWNRCTGNIVGGHQRYKVLLGMGETQIDCVVVDLDPQREKALNLALNRISGDWDEDKLAALMAELDASAFDISLTGFDAGEIDALMNKFYSAEAVQDNFDAGSARADIEAAGETRTKPGDLWRLGDHRLLCGDSADPDAMALLMGTTRAACAVTAPPENTVGDYKKDGIDPWLERMGAVVRNTCAHADIICWNMADLFTTGSQFIEPTGFYSVKLFADNNYRPLWIRVWKKQGILARTGSAHLTSTKPTREYEYVTAFAGSEVEEYNDQEYEWISAFAAHSYRYVRRLTKDERRKWGYAGVWEIAAMPGGKDTPPVLPVELPWRCIKMHSDPGQIILDPFAGSGVAIIAADQSGRQCYAMDNDPVNCDLAIMRWEQFTEETAKKLTDKCSLGYI